MKYYTITVNGNTYEVSVEENNMPSKSAVAAPAPVVSPSPVAPPAAATPVKEEVAISTPTTGTTGNIQVVAPMPGKIITTKVSVGQTVKKGDVVLILEAMKMENEIVAPQDGTIASIDVVAGQSVQAGNLLATMNQ